MQEARGWVLYRRRNRRFPVNRELETIPDPAQQVPVIRSTFVHRRPPRQRRETFSSDDPYPCAHRSLVCKRVCRIHVEMQRKAQEMK